MTSSATFQKNTTWIMRTPEKVIGSGTGEIYNSYSRQTKDNGFYALLTGYTFTDDGNIETNKPNSVLSWRTSAWIWTSSQVSTNQALVFLLYNTGTTLNKYNENRNYLL